MPTRKWKDAHRNLSSGDIVLIQYTSRSSPGTYSLGRVMTVEKNADELVRTCTVKYVLYKGDVEKSNCEGNWHPHPKVSLYTAIGGAMTFIKLNLLDAFAGNVK